MVWFPNQALESTQRHDRSSRQAEERKSNSTTDEDELKGVASGVKDEIVEAADGAKAKGVDQMAGVVHSAADELGRELPQAAGSIHSVADGLESASSALRERSVEDLVSNFNSFARRQPAAAAPITASISRPAPRRFMGTICS
jgi:hypothetical protein